MCSTSNICQACKAHSDCLASDACLPSGACALESEVVYLKEGGSLSPGAQCSKATPCGGFSLAASRTTATRQYIRVTGTIEFANDDIYGETVTILGEPGAALRGDPFNGGGRDGDQPILEIRGGAKVSVYDLSFLDARRVGLLVSEASELTLHRSKISNTITNPMSEEGLLVISGKATLIQSEVSNHGSGARWGVNLVTGELSMSQSKISNNVGGGVVVANDQRFSIVNSFITGNRTNGGVLALRPGAGSKFEFNTVVDNQDAAGSGDAGGVTCDLAGVVFSNNIIFRNVGGVGGIAQTFGLCTYGTSYVAAGTGPTDMSLVFKTDAGTRDYHLTSESPALVKEVPGVTCTGLIDYDGDARPQGGACDLGADEYKP